MRAYGRQELIGRHVEDQRYFDLADGILMGHGRRSKKALRKLQKKAGRNAIRRGTVKSVVEYIDPQ